MLIRLVLTDYVCKCLETAYHYGRLLETMILEEMHDERLSNELRGRVMPLLSLAVDIDRGVGYGLGIDAIRIVHKKMFDVAYALETWVRVFDKEILPESVYLASYDFVESMEHVGFIVTMNELQTIR